MHGTALPCAFITKLMSTPVPTNSGGTRVIVGVDEAGWNVLTTFAASIPCFIAIVSLLENITQFTRKSLLLCTRKGRRRCWAYFGS